MQLYEKSMEIGLHIKEYVHDVAEKNAQDTIKIYNNNV
jgi:hypothetical protein